MAIQRYEDHGQLQDGQLVTDGDGKLWRVSKHSFSGGPEETWLEHFSDEYAAWLTDRGVAGPGRNDAPLPLTVVMVVPQ